MNRVGSYIASGSFLDLGLPPPIGSVVRTFFLALNLFSAACDGDELAANPGGILQYGGPILYLIMPEYKCLSNPHTGLRISFFLLF